MKRGVRLATVHVVRRSLLLLVTLAACSPFAGPDAVDRAPSEISDAPPKAKPDSVQTPEPTTTSMPAEPAPATSAFSCQGAFFCDDFEGGPAGNGQWSNFKAIAGDQLLVAPSAPERSSANLFFVVAPGVKPTTHSGISRELGNHDRVELSFDVRIPASFGATGHVNLAHLSFGDDSEVNLTIIGLQNQLGLVTSDNNRNFESVNNVSVTMNTWHTLKLVVQLKGNATSKFTIDGTDAVADDGLDIPFGGPPPSSVTIGPDYKNSPDSFALHYDNVRIDVVDD